METQRLLDEVFLWLAFLLAFFSLLVITQLLIETFYDFIHRWRKKDGQQ